MWNPVQKFFRDLAQSRMGSFVQLRPMCQDGTLERKPLSFSFIRITKAFSYSEQTAGREIGEIADVGSESRNRILVDRSKRWWNLRWIKIEKQDDDADGREGDRRRGRKQRGMTNATLSGRKLRTVPSHFYMGIFVYHLSLTHSLSSL